MGDEAADFAAKLLAWYGAHARALPWREEPGLYATVVSEFMLQQTQVATVLPYFARWMEVFPDFAALAAAGEARVLRQWEGLGYYSRARNLHRLARELAGREAGEWPRRAGEWQALPGVGPYTAAAIASIACGERAAGVDGNVVRVLTRLTADETEYADGGRAVKALRPLAQRLVPEGAPGDYNQALMELGATVCTRLAPACTVCPVLAHCRAGQRGDAPDYPRLAQRKIRPVSLRRLYVRREGDGAVLLMRGPAKGARLAGIWELPAAGPGGLPLPAGARLVATKTRGISNQRITEEIFAAEPEAVAAGMESVLPAVESQGGELCYVLPGELEGLTLSGPHRRWVRELAGGGRARERETKDPAPWGRPGR